MSTTKWLVYAISVGILGLLMVGTSALLLSETLLVYGLLCFVLAVCALAIYTGRRSA